MDDVTVDVPRGRCFAWLGPNGCGKTTLIRMMLGLAHPSAARLCGAAQHPHGALSRVGGIVEEPRFSPNLSGRRNPRWHDALELEVADISDERLIAINRTLVEAGVGVAQIWRESESLEELAVGRELVAQLRRHGDIPLAAALAAIAAWLIVLIGAGLWRTLYDEYRAPPCGAARIRARPRAG